MSPQQSAVSPIPAATPVWTESTRNADESRRIAHTHFLGSRLLAVQGLRAVAALLVVWVHAIDATEFYSTPRQGRFFHLGDFGACGVDIFFAISGFIVSQVAVRSAARSAHPRSAIAGEFLTRRITRIFPLYWILTAVVIAIDELGRHKIDWHSFHWLPTLLLLPSLHVLGNAPALSLGWSLMFEMYFYLVLAAFMLWTPKHLARNSTFFLSGVVIAGLLLNMHRPILVIWMNPIVLEFVLGCVIGMMYSRTTLSHTSTRIGFCIALAGTILLAATIFTGYGKASEQDWILAGYYSWLRVCVWGVPAALLVGGVIFWSPAMRSAPARLLVFLGDASYSIYLCTIPARSIVEHYWRTFGRFGADLGVLLGALFCVVVGVTCYLLLERPLMRAFHNWNKPLPIHLRPGPQQV